MKKFLESCPGAFTKGKKVWFTKKKAICRRCGKLISIRRDGTLRNHGVMV